MTIAALRDYLPLADLGKIVVVSLVVAVVAPTAASVAIVGLDRREHATGSRVGSTALIVVGVAVMAALVAAGLYALTQK